MTRNPSARVATLCLALLAVLLIAPAPANADAEHVVERGETLGGIAASYGIAVEALQAWNRLANPNTIIEGTTIKIPDSATNISAASASVGRVTTVYVVQPGETLSSIATRFGVPLGALADLNSISNIDLIRDGSELTIPEGATVQSGTAQTPTTASTYRVQPGDSLSSIAARFGTSVSAIAAANGISNLNLVRIGASLSVPGGSAGASGGASPAPVGGTVREMLDHWAAHYGVPADLLKALTWFESGWNNSLVSSSGAMGIGQLMPDTVDFVSDVLIGLPLDPNDPNDNVRMSARFLAYLLGATGEPRLAIGAYYQGLASLRRNGIFQSSEFYVDGILALRSRF